VQLEFSVACESCVNGACAVTRRSIDARNSGGLELAPGDFVEVEIDERRSVIGILLVYSPPILLFALGYFGVDLVFPSAGTAARSALGGLVGMTLGLLLAWLAFRGRRQEALPRILARLDSADPAALSGPASETA
jgi:positive regulator of sigma E activity